MTKRISSNATLQALKPKEKEYSIPDKKVEGLNIRVRPTGTMTWTFRFQVGKKHDKISMGRYVQLKPERGMTLDQARKEAGRYRSWLENNKNPKIELLRERREQQEELHLMTHLLALMKSVYLSNFVVLNLEPSINVISNLI